MKMVLRDDWQKDGEESAVFHATKGRESQTLQVPKDCQLDNSFSAPLTYLTYVVC
jgi:hypothetical protein